MNDTELFSTYFNKSREYYLNKLERYNTGNKYVFNIYAFFFGIFWFMYRKMYLEALIIVIIIFVEGVLEAMVTANMSENATKGIGYFTNIVVAIVTGTIANYLYIRKAERTINKAMFKETDREKLISYLQKKGGLSYWFLIVVFFAIGVTTLYFYSQNNA